MNRVPRAARPGRWTIAALAMTMLDDARPANAAGIGLKGDLSCVDFHVGSGELVAVKVGASEMGATDLVFDPRAKGEPASDVLAMDDAFGTWSIGHPWRQPRVTADITFVVITHEPDWRSPGAVVMTRPRGPVGPRPLPLPRP